MKYTTLSALKVGDLDNAADGYAAASSMADHAKGRLNDQIGPKMRGALNGKSVVAALSQVKKLSTNFHYAQTQTGLIRTNLNLLAAELRTAQQKLKGAEADAAAEGFTITSDGSVKYPAGGDEVDGKTPEGGTVTGTTRPESPTGGKPIDPSGTAGDLADAVDRQAANANPNPHRAKALAIANTIAAAVKEATDADKQYAPVLRRLKADDDLNVSHADWADSREDMVASRKAATEIGADMPAAPKDGGTPKANAEWWKELSAEERENYIALHPAGIGAMDGLPSDVRDETNRVVLAERRGQYEMELASIPPEPRKETPGPGTLPSKEWEKWDEKYGDRREHLTSSINGMKAIQSRFDRTGEKGLPEAYLLGFDPEGEGNGKVILANGNPDTADHTAVHTPGTGTNLGGIDGDLNRSDKLWRHSSTQAPGESVSTVMWFDYDAPDSIPQATESGFAKDGGPTLQRFLEGTEAAQGGAEASHTTVSGHSYGSTVVGEAAKHNDLPADDVMVEGSPGMQVEHAGDLGVGSDHVWAVGADWTWDDSIVRQGGRLMGLGEGGTIPTDDDFGANVMEYGDYRSISGHSGFWDEGEGGEPSTSLRNMSRVVVGDYDNVELK